MIQLFNEGVWLRDGRPVADMDGDKTAGRDKTIAYRIMNAHDKAGEENKFRLKFDAMM